MDTSADRFNELDSKIKTVFTKTYNQQCQTSIRKIKGKKVGNGGEMAGMEGVYKEDFDPEFMEQLDETDVSGSE